MNQTIKKSVISVGKKDLTLEIKGEFSENALDLTICPLSGIKGYRLNQKTLINHVLPKYWSYLEDEDYYFCHTRECPVIYFNNQRGQYFGKTELRAPVAQKMAIQSQGRPLCYCKGVLEQQILDELLIKQCCDSLQDIQRYKGANLGKNCKLTNPSGRCCGKQIKEVIDWVKSPRFKITSPLLDEASSCCTSIINNTKTNE